MVASWYGNIDVVVALLQYDNVNVNLQNKYGDTALLWASRSGHTDIVVRLLTHDGHSKVDVNHQNQSGETAILRASTKGPYGHG
jgi:ankyrin repeat protein